LESVAFTAVGYAALVDSASTASATGSDMSNERGDASQVVQHWLRASDGAGDARVGSGVTIATGTVIVVPPQPQPQSRRASTARRRDDAPAPS
jgi:hypothetical protein